MRDVVTSVLRGALPSVLLPIRRVLIVAIIGHAALGVAELGTVQTKIACEEEAIFQVVHLQTALSQLSSSAVGDEVRLKD